MKTRFDRLIVAMAMLAVLVPAVASAHPATAGSSTLPYARGWTVHPIFPGSTEHPGRIAVVRVGSQLFGFGFVQPARAPRP